MDIVTKIFIQPNKREITSYKIFLKTNEGYFSLKTFYRIGENTDFFAFPPIGEWISAYIDFEKKRWYNRTLLTTDRKSHYPMGFHSYMDKDEAYDFFEFLKESFTFLSKSLCKCRIKYRLAYGLEKKSQFDKCNSTDRKIVVSRGLKIVRELEKME